MRLDVISGFRLTFSLSRRKVAPDLYLCLKLFDLRGDLGADLGGDLADLGGGLSDVIAYPAGF